MAKKLRIEIPPQKEAEAQIEQELRRRHTAFGDNRISREWVVGAAVEYMKVSLPTADALKLLLNAYLSNRTGGEGVFVYVSDALHAQAVALHDRLKGLEADAELKDLMPSLEGRGGGTNRKAIYYVAVRYYAAALAAKKGEGT